MSVLSRLAVSASILDQAVKNFFRGLLAVTTIAAAGSACTDATAITTGKVMVTAANGAKGVILPVAELDMSVEIVNTVSNQTLLVYPNTGAQINALTATTGAFSLVGGARGHFYCDSKNHWYVAAANLTGTSTSASTAELDTLAGVTAGTGLASKALVLDASGNLVMPTDGGIDERNAEVVAATNVILAAENGRTYFLSSATEFVSTLPAPAKGLHFTFIVTAAPSGASYTVVTNGSANIIKGNQNSVAGDAGDFGTADDTITFVDGQSVAGDKVEVFSDGTSWFAYAISKVAAGVTFTQAS